MRILIADDDPVTVLRLTHLLQRLGHSAVSASDGATAWQLIQRLSPHVVVSDWMMPVIDGLELCRRVRAKGGDGYIYFILLTGREGRDDRIAGLEAGADDFLTKPLDAGELMARLGVAERILGLHTELRDKARMLEDLSSQLARINQRLAQEATTDPLTGLYNRRHLEEMLQHLAKQADRHGRALALALADIDFFKDYNDRFGHPAGDEALRTVASSLQTGVRSHDLVARFGGEEFALVLPDAAPGAAWRILDRLRSIIEGSEWPLRPVTVSAGIANRRRHQPIDELLRAADEALYTAKRAGRNRVVHHSTIVGDDVALPASEISEPIVA